MPREETKAVDFTKLPFYEVKDLGAAHQKGFRWRYWNYQSKLGIYIVAVINANDGECFDWCAYIGANEQGAYKESDGWQEVVDRGAKLSPKEAIAIFPMFKDIPYRW